MTCPVERMLEADDLAATSDDPAYLRLRDAALAFAFMAKALRDTGDARFAGVDPVKLLAALDGILEAHYGTESIPSKGVH